MANDFDKDFLQKMPEDREMAEKGLGCSLIDDSQLQEDCKSLFKGKHSYRTWDEVNFGELWDACKESTESGTGDRLDCGVAVRRGLRSVESGRWNEAMNEMHRFVSALDKDEMELFARNHPRLAARVNGYAKVQELRKFDDLGYKLNQDRGVEEVQKPRNDNEVILSSKDGEDPELSEKAQRTWMQMVDK